MYPIRLDSMGGGKGKIIGIYILFLLCCCIAAVVIAGVVIALIIEKKARDRARRDGRLK